MKSTQFNKCLHGAVLPGRPYPPYRARSPLRRSILAADVSSPVAEAPRLTAGRDRQAPRGVIPHVLHVDADQAATRLISSLLTPEAHVTSVPTLDEARQLLSREAFALVVLDPSLPEGDAASLLPLLGTARLLVYSRTAPAWHEAPGAYLAKPWTSARQLWTAVAVMLGIPHHMKAGD